MRLLLVRRVLETSEPSLTEKIDWCRLGEASALYDVLLVSVEARVAVVAWVEMDELVSLRSGGETECNRWAGGIGVAWRNRGLSSGLGMGNGPEDTNAGLDMGDSGGALAWAWA